MEFLQNRILTALVVSTALLFQHLHVFAATTPAFVGQWPPHPREYMSSIVVSNGKAFAASRGGVLVFDVQSGGNPKFLKAITGPGSGTILCRSNLLFGCDNYDFYVIDFTDFAAPKTSRLPKERGLGSADVAVSGNTAFIPNGLALEIWDVSTPLSGRRLTSFDTAGQASGIAAHSTRAYLADGSEGLQIIDVSQPASPGLLKTIDTPGESTRVAIDEEYAYVADRQSGLQIISITNVASAKIVGSYPVPYACAVCVVGKKAFVTDLESGDIFVIGATDPANPILLGRWRQTGFNELIYGGQSGNPFILGDTAYVPFSMTFKILQFADAANPVVTGEYVVGGNTEDLELYGDYSVQAENYMGLQIVDVRNPAAPVRVGGFDTAGQSFSVKIRGSSAFVADGPEGLAILDISDVTRPALLGSYNSPGKALDVDLVDNLAFVADENAGLLVLDISNPAQPAFVGSLDTPGRALAVQVANSIAYVADGEQGLQIIGVNTPSQPTKLGSFSGQGFGGGLVVRSNLVYLTTSLPNALQIIDVTNPANPVRVGNFPLPGSGTDIFFEGNRAYIASSGGVEIVDITNPIAPVKISGFKLFGNGVPEGIKVRGQFAYVADGLGGLFTFNISDPTPFTLRETFTNGVFQLSIEGDLGRMYRIQFKNALSGPTNWSTIGNFHITERNQSISNYAPTGNEKYFRAFLIE